jgi:predicted dithiol-disulfide oxidoreductase (DUF899 family)
VTITRPTVDYAAARRELVRAEEAAHAAARHAAALRAALPDGPALSPSTPLTTAGGKPVTLAGLLGGRRDLLALHLDLDEGAEPASATALPWADGLDPLVPLLPAAVVLLSPAAPGVLAALAADRGWRRLRAVSTQPGALTDELGVRRRDGGLAPTATALRLGPDGVLRVHWQGAGAALDPLLAAGAWRALLPAAGTVPGSASD